MLKNLGSQVDTKTIVKGIEDAIKDTFLPLRIRADGLAHVTESTLVKINDAADRAAELWPKRIWKTASTAGTIVGLSIGIGKQRSGNKGNGTQRGELGSQKTFGNWDFLFLTR